MDLCRSIGASSPLDTNKWLFMKDKKPSRRDQILQSLAHMLETQPGTRITTARLAKEVGVSEAALYRHFPSKAKMFEGLIEFIEDTLFSRINVILNEEQSTQRRLESIMLLLLTFAAKNPGLCRILIGDALAGETDVLRTRMTQLFDRLETQLKQVFREAEIRDKVSFTLSTSVAANLLMAVFDGRVNQFVRSEFKQLPTEYWDQQWQCLSNSLLSISNKKQTAEQSTLMSNL